MLALFSWRYGSGFPWNVQAARGLVSPGSARPSAQNTTPLGDDSVDLGECCAKQQRELSTTGFSPHRQKTIAQQRLRPHPADRIPEIFKRNIDEAAR
jgi:hypothetical protein